MFSGFFNEAHKRYEWAQHGLHRRLMILLYYNRQFSRVGKGLDFHGKSQVHGQGMILAGKNLVLNGNVELWAGENATMIIGDNVFINGGVLISSKLRIEIGDSTLIGHQTIIFDTDWHGIDGNKPAEAPIRIGKHVWIGTRSIILKGLRV
jgi:carbonic anhydrase/acetyltransferase-like protein (isoleucine patch superfamily)